MSNPPPWGFWRAASPRPRSWARPAPVPPTTATGALVAHITGGADAKTFQPMNVNFGLFPPVDARGGRRGRRDRYKAYTDRAKDDWLAWLGRAGGRRRVRFAAT
jgi:folate-dependent tRNA-U54 methylase TrmFO/GidA